ncbi:MAG: DUF465 domain-containing protein [Pseudomonadota bacterium]
MSLSSHLAELQKKHRILERKIEEEERHPASDDLDITDLKRQKLHLKDQITRLSAQV